jgi:hypothetical protein
VNSIAILSNLLQVLADNGTVFHLIPLEILAERYLCGVLLLIATNPPVPIMCVLLQKTFVLLSLPIQIIPYIVSKTNVEMVNVFV